jgi:hypothetical protein
MSSILPQHHLRESLGNLERIFLHSGGRSDEMRR